MKEIKCKVCGRCFVVAEWDSWTGRASRAERSRVCGRCLSEGKRGLSYLRVHTCGHRSRRGRCYFPDEPSGTNNRSGCPFHGNGNLENCKIARVVLCNNQLC